MEMIREERHTRSQDAPSCRRCVLRNRHRSLVLLMASEKNLQVFGEYSMKDGLLGIASAVRIRAVSSPGVKEHWTALATESDVEQTSARFRFGSAKELRRHSHSDGVLAGPANVGCGSIVGSLFLIGCWSRFNKIPSIEDGYFEQSGANFEGNTVRWGVFKTSTPACNPKEKGGLFSRPELRGKDLNLRPLGYEPEF